ncbi:hypothetical protein HYZ64_03720 [Candidatus Berkelbacteria bacterium]|nr:hypothetical protein [Candidatus Berkelbacteria bacterium]
MFEEPSSHPFPANPSDKPKPSKGRSKILTLLFLLLLAAAIGGAAFFYQSYQQTKRELDQLKQNPNKAAGEEAKKLVEEVGKRIVLPDDEQPTIATVLDKAKLKDQTFFARAENGDKILIYPNAKKAFLYRESTNKIIEVGTINLEQSGQAATPTTAPQE